MPMELDISKVVSFWDTLYGRKAKKGLAILTWKLVKVRLMLLIQNLRIFSAKSAPNSFSSSALASPFLLSPFLVVNPLINLALSTVSKSGSENKYRTLKERFLTKN